MRNGPKDVLDRVARGEVVRATDYYLRIAPFSKRPPRNMALNGVGIGHRLSEARSPRCSPSLSLCCAP